MERFIPRGDDEQEFQSWYKPLAEKLRINPNPDDPDHHYDYRAFYQAMKRGEEVSPDQPGGHFPSTYKTEGHPRTYLDDGRGQVFDTRQAKYLTGKPVGQRQLTASEESPDMPGFDPEVAKRWASMMGLMGRR